LRRLLALVVAGSALVIAVGCTAEPERPRPSGTSASDATEVGSPLVVCPPAQGPPAPAESLLAGINLPCLTGGEDLELGRIGHPAVINLWASWCEPCRAELPELQRFADAAGEDVVVLGVVTNDTEAAATSLAADLGVTFPAVFDAAGEVRRASGQVPLPQTLFVDAAGNVRHAYVGKALTTAGFAELTRTHLGVSVG
jgi:thiol-disulfide isomerase/thioredoxin